MKALDHYTFRHRWTATGDAAKAYEILRGIDTYPLWWREVRSVEPIDDTAAHVRMRSLLPYSLNVELRPRVEDPERGLLEADLAGDLQGTSRWTIRSVGSRLDLVFDEDVDLTVPWIVRLGPAVRPVLKWNHSLMMRSGERGFRIYLAGTGFVPRR